jgi:polysaccharide export outer membrane protein
LRLGHIISIFRKPVLTVCAILLAAGGLGLTGCTDLGMDPDRLGNTGFVNPGEMMRANTHAPLMKPILDTLSSGYDEPNEEFPNARNVEAQDLEVNSHDYVIGRNDLLQITMTEVQPGVETAKTARVSESGNVTLPLIGQVQAAGLTEAQFENAVRDTYQRSGLVKTAQIAVTVLEARQRTFQIRGAVGASGQYAIVQSDFRLLDAIVLARDVTVPDTNYAYIIRPPADRAAAATQPATSQPSTPTPAPNTGGGNLLEPKPATPATTPSPATAPGAEAPKPTGATTLEDATKTPGNKPPVFVNGNQAVDAGAPAPAPSTDVPQLNPPVSAPSVASDFKFNPPLPEDQSQIIRVPLRQLLNGDLKFNVVIRPQDTIIIPNAR